MPVSHNPARQSALSPERCAACHPAEVDEWRRSHHAHANRPVDRALDAAGFSAKDVPDTPENVRPRFTDSPEEFFLEETSPPATAHPVDGVIGHDPLWQYLVRAERGRWQTHSLSYDPNAREWFELFPGEGRVPGEWGHWSGQGMNWNANCAVCHMSEFQKNYDVKTDRYSSTWTAHGVSCIQCHGNSAEHATAAENGQLAPAGRAYSAQLLQENCASCHSRREEITAHQFREGERFHDHFRLALPDAPEVYFPDGQSRDETFVYGSFVLSAMGHAGVSCMDCHNPHSGQLRLPANNNALCMQCHQTARLGAPIIDPPRHSHHLPGSSGNRCIECHMPARTYMVRNPRRDHGFTSPDPVLSLELGVPNACNQCHDDETPEWAAAHVETWYGSPQTEERRTRARLLAQVEDMTAPFPAAELADLAADEENAWWIAAYLRLLSSTDPLPKSLALAQRFLSHEHAAVRSAAIGLLATGTPHAQPVLDALADPARDVRLAAAQSLQQANALPPIHRDELEHFLHANADRPAPRLQLASLAFAEGDAATAERHLEQAIRFDRNNEQLYFEATILLARTGNPRKALDLLNRVPPEALQGGLVEYARALLQAEINNHAASARSLREAVTKNPHQARWWYNLALAYLHGHDMSAAQSAITEGLSHSPDDPDLLDLRRFVQEPPR